MLRLLFAGLIAAAGLAEAASAQSIRAKADVDCKPAGQLLHYDCVIKLMNARTSEPLAGVTLMVGADMPSMPMMHNVRPVKAAPGRIPGRIRPASRSKCTATGRSSSISRARCAIEW